VFIEQIRYLDKTQHVCSVAHSGSCVVIVVMFFFTLLQLVFSNICKEYDIILMIFVVNEIEHDVKQDKGHDKLQTNWQHEVVHKV